MTSTTPSFTVGSRVIGPSQPTYFIADIGANHDGSLERAKDLIKKAAESGADCAKFQHFKAASIVSDAGFRNLKVAHQAGWEKSVYETYEDYSINRDWTVELADVCKDVGVHFMTTPYDLEAIHQVEPYVPAFKIGSGDITYHALIDEVASMGKPVFLATGASTMKEVKAAVDVALAKNPKLCLMQCNTNYTGDLDNFKYVNLRVLDTFSGVWPGIPLGLSDHTPGYTAVLGAVALGACVIEKHFTDNITRKGPDHSFALEPWEWEEMVNETHHLEQAMGDGFKLTERNEDESRIVQRRAIRLKRDLVKGSIITAADIEFLRPCPAEAFTPAQVEEVIGATVRRDRNSGDHITHYDIYG